MLKRIDAAAINDETYQWIIDTLKTKLSLFDYVTEDTFKRILKEGSYLVYQTKSILIFCEIIVYPTGLKAVSMNVIKHSEEEDCKSHMKECLTLLEDEFRRLGLNRVILEGRVGWKKLFTDYEVEKITLRKEL